MPMVGIGMLCEISFATGGVTNSRTIANAPASASAFASSKQRLVFRFIFAFDVVAAFFQNMLRQHSEMPAKRNSRRDNGLHLRQNFPPAFGFHKFRAGGNQSSCIRHRVVNCLITFERQIAAEQRIRFRARGGADVMLHFRHRDMRRVRITEHDHAERIADEQKWHARFIEQFRHRKIISRERGNFFAARFHRANFSTVIFISLNGRIVASFGTTKPI